MNVVKRLPAAVAELPVVLQAADIVSALAEGNVLLRAQPGAGKSTGLPLALLLQARLNGRIILLEPRRLAARSVAQRLAVHLGEDIGQRIGLRMRSETHVSATTQLEVVTEGVLTRILQNDPALEGVALVIFDEFHERSVNADLGLALCLEVQQALREDLRLLLMSATLDTSLMHDCLQGAAVFDCAVRQHPVSVVYLGEQSEPLPQRIAGAVLHALNEQCGDILVFLPGVAEIARTADLLSARLLSDEIQLHRLHSGVSTQAQMLATAPSVSDRRRVILSTSLAETSITIDGVRVVIDSGLERRGRIDVSSGAQLLETVTASQASATQRAGRAGRTAAGTCYRLWSESSHSRRPEQWQPEILRTDISSLLLQLGLWGPDSVSNLQWLTPPPFASLSRAEELLTGLCLWEAGRLTEHGRKVASLPVHPRLGHMLLWSSSRGALELACRLVAWHEEQRLPGNEIDLEVVLGASLPSASQRRVRQLKRSVESLMGAAQNTLCTPSAAVILAQAFPDWIAQCRQGRAGQFLLACGAGVSLDNSHPLASCHYVVVTQMGGSGKTARVFRAMALDIEQLEEYSSDRFEQVNHLEWDDRQQRVIGEHRTMIGSLMINSRTMQTINDDDKAMALVKGICKSGVQCLPWTSECREWQARVQRMQKLQTKNDSHTWPDVDDASLTENIAIWLLPFLRGVGSMKALQQIELKTALDALLDYQQKRLLDEWLPTRYTVPSGSKIHLSYTQPGNPILSVKLQEMLGCTENPSVANGKLALKVELLSPAMRPIQVTEDLVGFWTGSYPAVKKDMAGRYPKHVWPENPQDAVATRRAKPRKSSR